MFLRELEHMCKRPGVVGSRHEPRQRGEDWYWHLGVDSSQSIEPIVPCRARWLVVFQCARRTVHQWRGSTRLRHLLFLLTSCTDLYIRTVHQWRGSTRLRHLLFLLTSCTDLYRASLVCSFAALCASTSRVLLRNPMGSAGVGQTTTLSAVRALPDNCSCVHLICCRRPASPSPAWL